VIVVSRTTKAEHKGALRTTELGQPATLVYALVCLGRVEAGQGREQECRSLIGSALNLFGPLGMRVPLKWISRSGFLDHPRVGGGAAADARATESP
jgi:hypothetical protein